MSQINATYSGVEFPRKATYTAGHGITPGVIWLEFLPQDPTLISLDATFSMSCYGGITLLNVRTDKATISLNTSRNVMELYAKDERWRWQFATVDYTANRPQPSGAIGSRERVSARDLCISLANILGVAYDFSLIPANQYPPVYWRASNAAVELERLVALYGATLVFDPFQRVIYAAVPGAGLLPDIDPVHIISQGIGVDQADGPADIRIVGQDIRYQTFVELEAVGFDPSDKTIRPIDDLSYAVDWTLQDPMNLYDEDWTETERLWARKTVFKWFRIKQFTTGDLDLEGWGNSILEPQPEDINDILPLDEYLITTGLDSNGRERQLNPFVVGRFAVNSENVESVRISSSDSRNTSPETIVEASYRIESAEGIVIFEAPIYKISEKKPAAPDLWLACSFRIRHPATNMKQYYYYTASTGLAGGVGVEPVPAPELTRIVIDNYTGGNPEAYSSSTDNADEINDAADALAYLKLQEYSTVSSYSVQYRHIWEISLNGAVRQMRYSVDLSREGSNPPPAYCMAYVNSESDQSLATAIQRFRIRTSQEFKDMNAEWRRKIFVGEGRDNADL